MLHADLYSGIGGFSIAAQQLGWQTIFHCEIDEFCQRVLRYHFPTTKLYDDIKETNFKEYKKKIDIVSAGMQCQPFSVCGQRKGAKDDRFLWHETLRAIQEIEPKWVVIENVRGIITQEQGLVFEQICSDLENENYEVQAFVIPAVAINAPHRRDRVWFIASNTSNTGLESLRERKNTIFEKRTSSNSKSNRWKERRANSNIKENDETEEWRDILGNISGFGKEQSITNTRRELFIEPFENFPTQSPICVRDDGFSKGLVSITFPKWRQESIKALGNAIVPQIAYEIFKIIENIEKYKEK